MIIQIDIAKCTDALRKAVIAELGGAAQSAPQKAAEPKPKKTETKAKEEQQKPAEEPQKNEAVSLEDFRVRCSKYLMAGGSRDTLQEAVGQYGATKIQDVPEGKRVEVLARIEE